MVTVTDVVERTNSQTGENFLVFGLVSDPVPYKSKSTGKTSLVVRRTSTAFNDDKMTLDVAQTFVGKQLQGFITRQACKPYPYTDKETGETKTYSHRWSFSEAPSMVAPASVPTVGFEAEPLEETE